MNPADTHRLNKLEAWLADSKISLSPPRRADPFWTIVKHMGGGWRLLEARKPTLREAIDELNRDKP